MFIFARLLLHEKMSGWHRCHVLVRLLLHNNNEFKSFCHLGKNIADLKLKG